MQESSKYNMPNNKGNISNENQGYTSQTVNIGAENIADAMKELKSEIGKLEGGLAKELAEANFELLNTYIDTKNKEKATTVMEKLKETVGNVSSLITIGTFLATL